MQGAGTHLFGEEALARGRRNSFAGFTAIAASSADALEVPAGFRADVLISWGDLFRGSGGPALRYGFNNDFLAYFPMKGSREGLLFVNHEYPDPFFLHGYKPTGAPRRPRRSRRSRTRSVTRSCTSGAAVTGAGECVSPSEYNRRIYGDRPGPRIHGAPHGRCGHRRERAWVAGELLGRHHPVGNRLSCEENFDGYGATRGEKPRHRLWLASVGGSPRTRSTSSPSSRSTAGSASTIPTTPSNLGRKHTALGRFRHENTAFRHEPGSRFVLYMGDDKANEGVYEFVSTPFRPRQGSNNRRILEEGTLYIARWEPEGRRRFVRRRHDPISATEGTGRWVEVPESALEDTDQAARDLRRRVQRPISRPTVPRTWRSRRTGASTSPSPTTARSTIRMGRCAVCASGATIRRRRGSAGETMPLAGPLAPATRARRASPARTTLSSTGRATFGWSPTSRRAA